MAGFTALGHLYYDLDHGRWSAAHQFGYDILSVLPFYSTGADFIAKHRDTQAYMKRYAIDYADVKNPHKVAQMDGVGGFVQSTLTYVSRNYDKLYRD